MPSKHTPTFVHPIPVSIHRFSHHPSPVDAQTHHLPQAVTTPRSPTLPPTRQTPPPSPPQPPHISTPADLSTLVTNTPTPLLVLKVYSRGCRSCKRIERPFARVAKAYSNVVTCAQLRAEDNEQLAQTLGVRGFPTFVLYKNGERVDHFASSCPEVLVETIEDNM
uniref:Thioredoxin n=1 Tax=Griffithsia japonica TaxID=83288 RepID=Q7XY77_GRIJA|nr:thioredoxin [Griffithsia japonica]